MRTQKLSKDFITETCKNFKVANTVELRGDENLVRALYDYFVKHNVIKGA